MSHFISRSKPLLAAAALALLCATPAVAQDLTVFAAASLQNAFEEIGRQYRQKTGKAVKFSFASSGALARQIEQGAPAAIFASADEKWMDHLEKSGLVAAGTRRSQLGNNLVLVVPAGSTAKVDLKPGFDFATLLGVDGRWATGDPASVPVGRYAQEALTRLDVWDFAKTRLVRTENVRVALTFVERGEVPAGIVYGTDAAIAPKVRIAGVFPADSHKPVTYPFAVIARHDSPAARQFLAFIGSDVARDVWKKFGFTLR